MVQSPGSILCVQQVALTSGRAGLLLWENPPPAALVHPSREPAIRFFLPWNIYLSCEGLSIVLGSPGSCSDPTCPGAWWEQTL